MACSVRFAGGALNLDTDYYAMLGLDRGCSLAQIRAAYRLLAKRHHPDVNGGAAESVEWLKCLNAAHETLCDPARRRAYDRELAAQEEAPPEPVAKGKIERNIAQDVLLRVGEFFHGTTMELRVNDPANPRGAESYELIVPPDTAPGTRLRLERAEPFGGGHVSVRLKVRPDARWKARGSDLRCDLRISTQRAVSGGSEMLPGPAGRMLRVNIPPGVARGELIRVPGEGLPKARGGRGDVWVKITYHVEVRVVRR